MFAAWIPTKMKCFSVDHKIGVWAFLLIFISFASGKVLCSSEISVLRVIFLGALLNGKCDVDANCGTLDSHCKNGTCSCIENFTTFEDSCVKGN